MAAWNTGNNLLYIVVGALFSFLVISFLLAGWSLRLVRVTREAPEAVNRGEPFGVTVRIENRPILVPAMSVRLERRGPPAEGIGYVIKIPPRRAAIVRVSECLSMRGVHPLPEIELVSAFPFGLFERRLPVKDNVSVVVYPRVYAVRPAAIKQLVDGTAIPRIVRGEGDEFFGLRDYVPGDDLRQVAWRVSARKGHLVVRECARETSRFIVLVLDTAWRLEVDHFPERFEEAVELTASLAVTFINQQYTVSIVTPNARLEPDQGHTHTVKVLEMLARVEPGSAEGVEPFDWLVPREDMVGASILLVSPDPMDWGSRGPKGRGNVVDPREMVRA
jgi:uncharacterized protein (DUF58 family)